MRGKKLVTRQTKRAKSRGKLKPQKENLLRLQKPPKIAPAESHAPAM